MFVAWVFGISVLLDFIGLGMLGSLFNLAVLLPSLGLGARRLHDINLSGWWQLVGIIPIIGWIILIVLMAKPTEPGVNAYDKTPEGEAGTGETAKADSVSTQVDKVVGTMKATIGKVSNTFEADKKTGETETTDYTPAENEKPEEPKA